MKPAQMTFALIALAFIVFLATFITQYVGDTESNRPVKVIDGADAGLELTFGMKQFPPELQPPIEQEQGRDGHWDFWFVNENDRPVEVWLNSQSCKCSEVLVFLAPPSWQERRSAQLASQVTAVGPRALLSRGALGPVAGLIDLLSGLSLVLAAEQDGELRQIEKEMKGEKITDRNRVEVPAGRAGWVRVTWKGDRTGGSVTSFSAEVWMGKGVGSNTARLVAGVRFLPPLRLAGGGERKLGYLNPRDLPREESIVYWSSTRPELEVEARLVSVRKQPETDPFKVGQPQPLTGGQLEQLQQELKEAVEPGLVRCAYRVPVIIRDQADDDHHKLDLGRFRRQIELRLKGQEEPILVTMTGAVMGDVRVGGNLPGEEGLIRFNAVDYKKGSKPVTIPVHSETPGVKLEVNQSRTAPFLDVKIKEDKEASDASGLRTWMVQATVKPQAVLGAFPRDDNPALRDSAVYLNVLPSGRTIRIPVQGTSSLR